MQVFNGVADRGEVLLESLLRDDNCSPAVVGMEREGRCLFEPAVEEKDDMVFRVVNQSERAD